jgi:hypothetical protein
MAIAMLRRLTDLRSNSCAIHAGYRCTWGPRAGELGPTPPMSIRATPVPRAAACRSDMHCNTITHTRSMTPVTAGCRPPAAAATATSPACRPAAALCCTTTNASSLAGPGARGGRPLPRDGAEAVCDAADGRRAPHPYYLGSPHAVQVGRLPATGGQAGGCREGRWAWEAAAGRTSLTSL